MPYHPRLIYKETRGHAARRFPQLVAAGRRGRRKGMKVVGSAQSRALRVKQVLGLESCMANPDLAAPNDHRGNDVHKKMLAVAVADVAVEGDFHSERHEPRPVARAC
jgi:hypothetical protein